MVLLWNKLEEVTKPFWEEIQKTTGVELGICFVDNGSTDGTKEWLEALTHETIDLTKVYNKTNEGFAAGNNHGFRLFTSRTNHMPESKQFDPDYIGFINNDVVVNNPDWLAELVYAAGENSVSGVEYVTTNGNTYFDGIIHPYLNGWCVVAHKNVWEDIKVGTYRERELWDEGFKQAYFEDVDLSIRAKLNNHPLVPIPCGLTHLGSRSSHDQDMSPAFQHAKAYYFNKMLSLSRKRRIVFFIPKVPYAFSDPDFEGKGVGGAEASLIGLTREMAKNGWMVEVYNATETMGTWNGVTYRNISQFDPRLYCDVFVLFRSYHPVIHAINTTQKYFWSCDQYTDDPDTWSKFLLYNVDKTICISKYHEAFLRQKFHLPEERTQVIDLGVDMQEYENLPIKGNQIIFCSVPQRGLAYLAALLPEIKRRVPDMNCIITSDYRLWGLDHPNNSEFVELLSGLDYVQYLGKVPRSKLVSEQKSSKVLAYPCTYEECFCISANECMAAGAIPVTTKIGAMATTVKDGGVVINGQPGTEMYDTQFVNEVCDFLLNDSKRTYFMTKGRKIARSRDWSKIYEDWITLFRSKEVSIEREYQSKDKRKAKGGELVIICPDCKKEFKTSFMRWKACRKKMCPSVMRHEEESDRRATEIANKPPTTVVVRFSRPVEFGINGRWFAGREIEVPFVSLEAALQTVRDAYGDVVDGY